MDRVGSLRHCIGPYAITAGVSHRKLHLYNTPVNTHKSCVILRRPNHTHTNMCALFMYIVQHRVIYNKKWLFRVCRKSKCGIFPLAPSFVLRLWHLPTNFVARNRAGRPCTKVLDKTLSHSTHTHTNQIPAYRRRRCMCIKYILLYIRTHSLTHSLTRLLGPPRVIWSANKQTINYTSSPREPTWKKGEKISPAARTNFMIKK